MSRSWSTRTAVEDPELLAFNVDTESRDDADDGDTKQNVRSIVSATWRWGGVDVATMLWHVMQYRGNLIKVETAADVGISLLIETTPTVSTSALILDNLSNATATFFAGWRFMVWDDPTIYTLTANATATASVITLAVSPVITAATVTLGANTPVYFFIPNGCKGTRKSADQDLNAIRIDAEFTTPWEDVDQPEEA